jgi:hypothetical protein
VAGWRQCTSGGLWARDERDAMGVLAPREGMRPRPSLRCSSSVFTGGHPAPSGTAIPRTTIDDYNAALRGRKPSASKAVAIGIGRGILSLTAVVTSSRRDCASRSWIGWRSVEMTRVSREKLRSVCRYQFDVETTAFTRSTPVKRSTPTSKSPERVPSWETMVKCWG